MTAPERYEVKVPLTPVMFANCPVSPVTTSPLIVPEVVKLFCTITPLNVPRLETVRFPLILMFPVIVSPVILA